jgi:RHS repeat-associated protein
LYISGLKHNMQNTRVTYSPTISGGTINYMLENVVDYYPYGKVLRAYQNGQQEKYLFTQHERDKETGYDNLGARLRDAEVIPFLSLDPKAMKYPSLSPYNYVANNPIMFIDPDGREIKVASEMQSNGREKVTISFTAEMINTSSTSISKEQLTNIRNVISNQIIESFGGEKGNFDIIVSVDIEVKSSFMELSNKSGHIISIVNPDDEIFDENDAGATTRYSSEKGNIFISSSIVENEKQLKRTGAHEFGHAAGLKHPFDETGTSTKIDDDAGKDPDNLMIQSRYTSGTNINEDQINQIKKDNP